ncbi:hypothetical protein Acel_2143 [Acidothermus cellulolyticus 11B]|jgi:hypothetical protein|uniref:Uncharacterized protein n=1 Tax=Acidothermus cellulolyticus (strain ATCC 43068 / DSM 8971 / 11B) TaxID=351607 RepID=A0LWV5_ACIC1|nr:hypothetical protein [Acidothermus cellulolyticus]ABK53915.1 hypothetical protein Acel_2143 [Acidothermus cellulolyticus 11B]MCL6549647.1 hypothetical protein [Acidothermus cellulolyticus]
MTHKVRWVIAVPAPAGDRGDIVLGWLARVVVGIVAVALVCFDGFSIAIAHLSAIDDADKAAIAASSAWQSSHGDTAAAAHAAQVVAAEHGETLVANSLSVSADGTADLTIRKTATTLLLRHLGPLRTWAVVTAHGEARYTAP